MDDTAQRLAREAQTRAKKFAEEHQLQQRYKKAASAAGEALEEAAAMARRTYLQLDSEHGLQEKASRAARKAKEVALDIDQTHHVRRRVRSTRDYMRRHWPAWQKHAEDFGSKWYGRATIFAGLFLLVATPAFASLVHLGIICMCLYLPAIAIWGNVRLHQAQQAQRRAAEEEQERARRRSSNPFAEMFRSAAEAAGSMASSRQGGRNKYVQQYGPVVAAEFTPLDELIDEERSKGRR